MSLRSTLVILLALVLILPVVKALPPGSVVLDVPYVHQVYDVPEWFDGRYSCGPTSIVMVLAYWKVIEPWPFEASMPYKHTSEYGRYVCCIFKVGDFVFDKGEVDASRKTKGYGVHGFTYIPGAGMSWQKAVDLFKIFGFQSYIDYSPTFEELKREIDNGYPVLLSTQLTKAGHIVVAVGYTPDGCIIVNDPAGDKNRGSYFNYYGKQVVYDWPGVNKGHVNLNKVKAFIIVHPTENLKKAIPVSERPEEEDGINVKTWVSLAIIIVAVCLIIYLGVREKLKATRPI